MSTIFKRTLPLIMTSFIAMSLILNFFFDFGPIGTEYEGALLSWCVVIVTASMGLGLFNLAKLHVITISKREPGKWPFSIILLASMVLMILIRIFYTPGTEAYDLVFDYTYHPIRSTVGQLFIVWLAAPFARAVRVRGKRPDLGGILLIGAFALVIIGNTPLASYWGGFTDIASWLLTVNNMATKRAIAITVGLGLVAMGARIISGREKTYLREEFQ